MIEPKTTEAEWLRTLTSLPVWDPPQRRTLVVSPHPDDETLGAGGLIKSQRLRGLEVVVAAVTDGEGAYDDVPGLGELRTSEQTEALRHLGVDPANIIRFALPDRHVASHETHLEERLAALLTPDTHVVAPWDCDFHPDHEACGRIARRVAERIGASLSFYFFWTWHFGEPQHIHHLRLHSFPLTAELLQAKRSALDCHRSQLFRDSAEPVLPARLLAPAWRPLEVFSQP